MEDHNKRKAGRRLTLARRVGASAMVMAVAAMMVPASAGAQERERGGPRAAEGRSLEGRGSRGPAPQARPSFRPQPQQQQRQVRQNPAPMGGDRGGRAERPQRNTAPRNTAPTGGWGDRARQTGERPSAAQRDAQRDAWRAQREAQRASNANAGTPGQRQGWRPNRDNAAPGTPAQPPRADRPDRDRNDRDRNDRTAQQWRERQEERRESRDDRNQGRGEWRGRDNDRADGRRDGRWNERRAEQNRPGWQTDRNGWQNNRQSWRDNRPGDRRDDRRWDRGWRNNDRYNWSSYRARNRAVFRPGRYYSPYANYSYNRLSIGFQLQSLFYGQRYWVSDPWQYRLPEVYGPYRWVRYYDDVLLVDIYSGEVVDVIYDFFW